MAAPLSCALSIGIVHDTESEIVVTPSLPMEFRRCGDTRRHPPAITGRTATPTPTMSVSLRRRRYYPRWGRQQNQNQNQNQQEGTARGNPPLTYRPSSGQQQRPQRQQHLNRFASDSSATSAALTASPASQAGGGDPEREDGPGTDERATSTKAAVAPRKRFNGLLADRFQHPFDLVCVFCLFCRFVLS